MKKNRPGKRPPRLSTRILLAVLAAALAVNGYFAWQILGKPLQTEQTQTAGSLSPEEQKRLDAQEERDNEIAESGSVGYSPSRERLNDREAGTVYDESSALDALEALQYDMNIGNVREEYQCVDRQTVGNRDYYTMQQYWQGVPVLGYSLVMDVDGSGQVESVDGAYYEIEEFDPSASLDEYDARDAVEYYLERTAGMEEGTYELDSGGKVIAVLNDEPKAVYQFFLADAYGGEPYRSLLVDGNTGDVLADNNWILTEAVSGDLTGQKTTYPDADYWKDSDTSYKLYDEGRNIQIYYTTASSLSSSQVNDSSLVLEHEEEGPENFDRSAVDALGNLQFTYDYYLDNFQQQGVTGDAGTDLKVITNIRNYDNQNVSNNAFMSGTRIMGVGVVGSGADATKSAELDVMGHEYTHGVVNAKTGNRLLQGALNGQQSVQFAISECMADIMGEFVEDYSDNARMDNSCDWVHGSRSMIRPSGDYLDDAEEFIEGTTDCHYGITVLSHPAYLIANGIDGDSSKAIDNETMQKIWYTAIMRFTGSTDFQAVRKIVEELACEACYGGGYRNGDLSFELTEKQLECIVDAFDRTNIRTDYNLVLSEGAGLTVYDQNYEAYDNYHITVTQMQGSEVMSQDVHTESLQLNLSPGLYNIHLEDLANEDLTKDVTLIVNNEDTESKIEYQDTGVVVTDFGTDPRDVVLVLDVSGSMNGTPLSETKQAAVKFVETVLGQSANTRISIVTYSDTASVVMQAENNIPELRRAVNSLESGGGTNLYTALEQAQSILDGRRADTKMIVVMSDGLPNNGPTENGTYTEPIIGLADQIKQDNILVYSLGFFHNCSSDELAAGQSLMEEIASPGYHYEVTDSDSIAYVLDDVAQQVGGNQYLYIRIACPVDVTVEKGGEVLSSDEQRLSTRTSFGTLTLTGEGDDQEKILRLDTAQDYEITIEGNDRGTMDVSLGYPDAEGDYSDTRYFENVPVTDTSYFSMNTRKEQWVELKQDGDGDGVFEKSYSAKFNSSAVDSGERTRNMLLIVLAVLLAVWLGLHIFNACRRYRRSRFCSQCGAEVKSSQNFCAKCGAPVQKIPLVDFGIIGYPKEKKGFKITKIVFTCIFGLTAVAGILLYRSPACTVYRQLMDSQYQSAERIYENAVRDTLVNEKYFDILSDVYLMRVEQAEEQGTISEAEAQEAYDAAAGLTD